MGGPATCAGCGEAARLACVCATTSYCSTGCQKKDWSRHKTSCPPVAVRAAGEGRGLGVFATRTVAPGTLLWAEEPLITYRKDPKESVDTFLTSLYTTFCQQSEERRQQLLELYDPGEEAGKAGEQWRVARISNANEVGGGGGVSSVYVRYSRLNHACCRNAVGQVGEAGRHQVRAVARVAKGEEVTVNYLEGRLGTTAERQAMFRRKWGFACACRACTLPEEESAARDSTIAYVRETQGKVARGEFGAKAGRSHAKALQDLHSLLAACYTLEEQDQLVLRCVLLAIVQGMRKVEQEEDLRATRQGEQGYSKHQAPRAKGQGSRSREKDMSLYCPKDLQATLETKLGTKFWTNISSYEKEAMRVAELSGHAKKMMEYMA